MKEEIVRIQRDALARIAQASDRRGVEDARVAILGKKGELTLAQTGMKNVPREEKPAVGQLATANKWLMTDVLRGQWGFNGFVVTDYTGISEMIDHGIGDLQTVSARAINAGVDMDMVSEGFVSTLKIGRAHV